MSASVPTVLMSLLAAVKMEACVCLIFAVSNIAPSSTSLLAKMSEVSAALLSYLCPYPFLFRLIESLEMPKEDA